MQHSIDIKRLLRDVSDSTRAFDVLAIKQPERLSSRGDIGVDYCAELLVRSTRKKTTLLIEVKNRVTPRDVLQCGAMLKSAIKARSREAIGVLCSQHISERSARFCEEAGIGYIDLAGNCRLAAPGLFVLVTGRSNPEPDTRSAVNAFAAKSSRVARMMLAEPARTWFVKELAEQAGVSIGLVSKVKQALLGDALIEEVAGLLKLRDPAQMLDAWAKRYATGAEVIPAYVMSSPDQIEHDIARSSSEHGYQYVVTGLAAAWRYAPMVRYQQPTVYILQKDAYSRSDLLKDLGAKPVDSGSNITIMVTDDDGPFMGTKQIDGLMVASAIQAYLDLQDKAGRAEEAAQALMEQCIAPAFGNMRKRQST